MLNLKLKTDDTEFVPCPPGTWNAVCVESVYLGVHENTYNGVTTMRREARLIFEIDQMQDSGDPFTITYWLSIPKSFSKKSKIRFVMEGVRGKPYEKGEEVDIGKFLEKMAGQYCKLTVVHTFTDAGNKKASIAGFAPATKADHFSYQTDPINNENFLEGSQWLQDKIAAGMKNEKMLAQSAAAEADKAVKDGEEVMEDDVPW